MRTLITDPFADDARSILEWAYGKNGALRFDQNHTVLRQRPGQAFMNSLYDLDKTEFDRLNGTFVDPFYDDTKLPEAIDRLTSKDGPHFAYHSKNDVFTKRTACGCSIGNNHWVPDGK